MKLTVGITGWLPQWRILLNQTGLPVEKIIPDQRLDPGRCAAVIVSNRMGREQKDILLNYLAGGGALLMEAGVGEWLLGIQTFPSYVKYLDPTDDPVFSRVIPGSVDARLILPRQADLLRSDSLKPMIQVVNHGSGTVVILPGMLSSLVLDSKSRRRNFPTQGPRLPSERVSRRSKSTLRTIIQLSLEYLFRERRLPMVSLSPLPHGKSTLFSFRVDTDFASEENIDALAAICRQHNIPATWFVETAGARNYLKKFSDLNHQKVGIHCYRHRVYRDYTGNERDIAQAKRVLSLEKIRAQGYASPFGSWNAALQKAVEHHGFLYSSEFSLDYDDLPFYPFLEDRFSSVLQVPIHPVTTGHLRNARHSEEDMKKYWLDRIEDHQRFQLPLIVYDHPSQANLDVLNWLFDEIHGRGIPVFSLLDYARWWIRRTSLSWSPELDGDVIRIHGSPQDSSIWVDIHPPAGGPMEHARIEMSDSIKMKTLKWEEMDPPPPNRTPVALLRVLNRKMIINEILNRYWRYRTGRRGGLI